MYIVAGVVLTKRAITFAKYIYPAFNHLALVLQDSVEEELYINFPGDVSDDFRDITRDLLQSDPSKRLGNLKDGAFGIKKHPFFKRVTWRSLFKQKIKAPYIPSLGFAGDTKHFRSYGSKETLKTADVDKHSDRFMIFPKK